jgi:hypothetical protein
MSLLLQKSDAFLDDFALQALWSVREAGDEVARGFQHASIPNCVYCASSLP